MAKLKLISLRLEGGERRALEECKAFLVALSGAGCSVNGKRYVRLDVRSWSHRKRSTFSLKRSPHVFSKSQENFGREVCGRTVQFRPGKLGGVLTRRRAYQWLSATLHYYPGVNARLRWVSEV